MIVGEWKMYQKAGKQGWECIVPFYSNWVYVEISGLNWWWFFVVIAGSILTVSSSNGDGETISFNFGTLIGLFGMFVCNYNVSKKLHRDAGFAVLMTIFPYVMYPLIGFSSNYQFDNDLALSKNGPFPDNGTNNNSEVKDKDTKKDNGKVKYCPRCGTELDKNSKFCSKCGEKV